MANPPSLERLRSILFQGRPEKAVAMLQQLDPADSAEALTALPFPEQQNIFRKFSLDFAARLVEVLPYYHAYVLLHSRPKEELTGIIDRMNPGARLAFFDELPEEAFQHLMGELSEKQFAPPQPEPAPAAAVETVEVEAPPTEPPIIEARQIEKSFQRPDGGQVKSSLPPTLRSSPARSSLSSDRRAPASRRCCVSFPGSRSHRPARSSGTERRSQTRCRTSR